MLRWLLVLAVLPCYAQPLLRSVMTAGGIERAVLVHADSGATVSDANPARPGERLIGYARSLDFGTTLRIDSTVATEFRASSPPPSRGLLRSRSRSTGAAQQRRDVHVQSWQNFEFVVPETAAGGFVEMVLTDSTGSNSSATLPVRREQEDATLLTQSDVTALIESAATAIDEKRMAIAIADRAGRPLAVFRKSDAGADSAEIALSLARTSAFFSNNMAPLSSRTVQTISRENFPNNVPNQPAAALFGIENTNRGCFLTADYAPGQQVPPAMDLAGAGPGKGITATPGSVPLYKSGKLVGGIGVSGISADQAEFAAFSASLSVDGILPLPVPEDQLPPPGAVFIDGIRLPFVLQRTQPSGTQPAGVVEGEYLQLPRAGGDIANGWLVEPMDGNGLTASEVEQIINSSVARAEKTRAVIRLPLGSRSRMAMAVSDLDGKILGMFNMSDGTGFSIDVAASKARNVVYFSRLDRLPDDLPGVPLGTAVTNRTIGFGAQSFFPSGISGSNPGPFRELYLFDLANPCTQGRQPANPNQSEIVFFPGSAPLYKNGVLVGGLGVSGDGVEQDDYVTAAGAAGFEPPSNALADRVFVDGVRLPYWRFPRNPEQ
jgi:uncharacterized protein GlcG (DUF336 family)